MPGWGDSFEIFVPRKNKVLPVPQAPPRLLAFLEAFRAANEALRGFLGPRMPAGLLGRYRQEAEGHVGAEARRYSKAVRF